MRNNNKLLAILCSACCIALLAVVLPPLRTKVAQVGLREPDAGNGILSEIREDGMENGPGFSIVKVMQDPAKMAELGLPEGSIRITDIIVSSGGLCTVSLFDIVGKDKSVEVARLTSSDLKDGQFHFVSGIWIKNGSSAKIQASAIGVLTLCGFQLNK